MKDVKKSDVTYGQLGAALRDLGFAVSDGKNALGFPVLRFENAAQSTVILLRNGGPGERLNAADLFSVEETVAGRGVTTREAFRRLLREATPQEAQAA